MKQLFLVLLLHVSLSLFAEDTLSVEESVVEKKAIEFIEVSSVPDEAVKTNIALKKIKELLSEEDSTYEMHEAIPSYVEAIDTLLEDSIYETLEQQNIRILKKLYNSWSVYINQLEEWEGVLKTRIVIYDENKVVLNGHSKLWAQTHINADSNDAPELIKEHISNVIIEIESLRNSTKEYYDALLTDTNFVSIRLQNINEAKDKIEQAQLLLSKQIFQQTGPTLFELLQEQSFAPTYYFGAINEHFKSNLNDFRIYHEDNKIKVLYLLLCVLIISSFVGYFNYLYRHKKLFVKKESIHKSTYFFIGRPISTLLILTELCVVFIYPDTPGSIRQLELLILLIPFFRIMQTIIPRNLIHYFYIYFGLYFLSLVEKNGEGIYLEDRLLNIFLSISLIVFIVYIFRHKLMNFIQLEFVRKFIYTILPLFVLLLSVSVFANLYGMTFLSERITEGIFRTIHSSIIFFVLTIILTGYLVIMFRRRISTASNVLDKYAKNLERIISIGIKVIMFLWWAKIVLVLFGINEKIVEIRESILNFSWNIGTTTFSVESLVNFTVILIGTWALAKFVRIMLEVEIFSRFTFPRGFPTAIATVSNYIIVITGVIIALSSLGISTEQFTLVFGALGVGIGFGLRNIIANFVSGIIMVFERPVQIGDTIEIDSTTGTVQSIGTRASYIQTFDGSEVIIPNADFIATKVTNWTLSDERRRKVLMFKVDFESDIDEVLQIMKKIAVDHPNVLQDPEPLATFNAFGEYYLEFKLYFWLTENLIVAQSDIAIGVYKALKEAGVKMPLPKQEVKKEENVDSQS